MVNKRDKEMMARMKSKKAAEAEEEEAPRKDLMFDFDPAKIAIQQNKKRRRKKVVVTTKSQEQQ